MKDASQVQLKVRSQAVADWMTAPAKQTLPIGDYLHVVVTELRLAADAPPLGTDTVYEYDLELTPLASGAKKSLRDQPGLLDGSVPLGYGNGSLPSFSLPPAALSDLRLLHGSCRKPHGGGRDAAEIADRMVEAAIRKAAGDRVQEARLRPHHLLLTGDQIYADDVPLSLLVALNELGGLLIGTIFPEAVDTGDEQFGIDDLKVAPGWNRQQLLAGQMAITSGAKDNHLVFFAEFCAMYLMVWSDELWLRAGDGSLTPPDVDAALVTTGEPPRINPKLAAETAAGLRAVRSFARTIRRVRRAMANIPTMMTIDDHEVTDDWNLDAAWVAGSGKDVLKSIVRNGLLAQAVFQAWGNTPEAFEGNASGRKLLGTIAAPAAGQKAPLAGDPRAADGLLGLGGQENSANRVRWDWSLDGPQHRIISLDTRTHRELVPKRPAGLLTAAEMDRQLSSRRPGPGDSRLCFVVSAAPVMGNPYIETIVQPITAAIRDRYYADAEAWAGNQVVFQSLLARLAKFGRVVVLSGDVHYSFTNHTAYFQMDGTRGRIIQLCASAFRNAEFKTSLAQGIGYLRYTLDYVGFPSLSLDPAIRRKLQANVQNARDTQSGPAVVIGYSNAILNGSLMRPPVAAGIDLVPAWLLTPAVVKELVDHLRGVLAGAAAALQHFEYRLTSLADMRSSRQRVADAGLTDAVGLWTRLLGEDSARNVVGSVPALGEVRVVDAGGGQELVHRLHWDMRGLDPKGGQAAMFTEHRAPLAPPTDQERPFPEVRR